MAAGNTTINWAESVFGNPSINTSSDDVIDLVNSMQVAFTTAAGAGAGMKISLLSVDHLPTGQPPAIGMWELAPQSGLTFASAILTFRYDDVAAAGNDSA